MTNGPIEFHGAAEIHRRLVTRRVRRGVVKVIDPWLEGRLQPKGLDRPDPPSSTP